MESAVNIAAKSGVPFPLLMQLLLAQLLLYLYVTVMLLFSFCSVMLCFYGNLHIVVLLLCFLCCSGYQVALLLISL